MNQPVRRLQHGALSVSLFPNVVTRDGETSTFHSAVVTRSFRDGDEWRTSNSFTARDLPILIRLLECAYDEMLCLDGQPSDDLRERLTGKRARARKPAAEAEPAPENSAKPTATVALGPSTKADGSAQPARTVTP